MTTLYDSQLESLRNQLYEQIDKEVIRLRAAGKFTILVNQQLPYVDHVKEFDLDSGDDLQLVYNGGKWGWLRHYDPRYLPVESLVAIWKVLSGCNA